MRTTTSVEHVLTDDDKLELSKELAEKITEFGNVITAKKAALAGFKSNLDELDKKIQDISHKIMVGYFWEERVCDVEDDLENNVRIYKDPETNEILKQEPLDDSQPNMFQKTNSDDTQDNSIIDDDEDAARKHPQLVNEEEGV